MFTSYKFTRRDLLSALSLFPAARLLSGQEGPAAGQPPKYSADVKVVNVFATVRDKSGKIIKDLSKDDFSLDEEGRPQTIKFFERESSLPLYLGLLVDTSGSQARVLGDERTAGLTFFDQILREDRDLAFVIHFDYETELLQDFTASRQKLEQALDLLQVGRPPQQQTQQQGGNYTRREATTRRAEVIRAEGIQVEAIREAAIPAAAIRRVSGTPRAPAGAAPKCTMPFCSPPTT